MFSPCGGSVISFIDNGLLRGWATADVEEINGGIFFFTFFQREMGDCALLWSVMWAVILIVFGWPIGLICALFYCLLSPCAACCHGCVELINLLDRGVKLPLTCSQNMVSGKSMCWKRYLYLCWHDIYTYTYIYIYVCVWKISNNLHTMYDGFNSREDINQHIKTLVFSSQF